MNRAEQTTNFTEAEIDPAIAPFWLPLDNAAKIYPAVQNSELTSVFRLSCILKDHVRITALLDAVKEIENRFPYYKMTPGRGLFWYYLEYRNEPIPVIPDFAVPCRAFVKGELIFRVLVKSNRISVEFSHILTDGSGAFEFLRTLLIQYFRNCNLPVDNTIPFLNPADTPAPEEFEDGFSRYFQQNIPSPGKKQKAYHLPFKPTRPGRFSIIVAKVDLTQISGIAKKFAVTITEFLVGVYLSSIQAIYNSGDSHRTGRRKILRIQVPVNLRRLYASKTMRNFSLFVTPEIDLSLGHYSFEEILKTVHHFMQLETDKKMINKMIARNVGAERNVLLKSTPLFIKSLILYFTYTIAGPAATAE